MLNKYVIASSCLGSIVVGLIFLTVYGPSFQATSAIDNQTCTVSATMLDLNHCKGGTYSIHEFCEWERKGTLRSRFCGMNLAAVSLSYTAAATMILSVILGCMHFCGGKLQQCCVGVAHLTLHVISAVLCVIVTGMWLSAQGSLPGISLDRSKPSIYDVSGELGSEWAYNPASHLGNVQWTLGWGAGVGVVGAVVSIISTMFAFMGLKEFSDLVVIRVDLRANGDVGVLNDRFVDATIITTGAIAHTEAITGMALGSPTSPPSSPVRKEVVSVESEAAPELDVEAQLDAKPVIVNQV